MKTKSLNLMFIGIVILFLSYSNTLSAANNKDNNPAPAPKDVQINENQCLSWYTLISCTLTVNFTDCPVFSCPATACTNLWINVYDWDGSNLTLIDRINFTNRQCSYSFSTFSIESSHTIIVNVQQSGTSCGSPWNNTPQSYTPSGTITCNRSFCGS